MKTSDRGSSLPKANRIDLHVHSNRSDGTFSPAELVDRAIKKRLAAFALTDHDTVDGLEEAMDYAAALRRRYLDAGDKAAAASVPEVIPGIELSTEHQGRDIHIVGLYIDHRTPDFQDYLTRFLDSRDTRNRKMCELLRGAGIDISYEKLTEEFPDCVLTRAHFARYMLSRGYISHIKEAFERYIGDHCPCFVPREKVTPAQAVQLILKADGVPVLAHPLLYGMSERKLDALTAELKETGLIGIEALYSTYSAADERQIRSLARKYNLLVSGGSDFHGANKPGLDLGTGYGRLQIPVHVLDAIRATRKNLLFADLDGTLLLNDSTISPPMRKALNRMTSAGHHLILSSGRPLPSILEVREKERLSHRNTLILANNGALVYDCDRERTILERRLSCEDIRYIVDRANEAGIHIHGYTEKEIVCRCMDEELEYYIRRIHMPIKYTDNIAACLPQGCFKLLAIHLTDKSALEAFRSRLAGYCEGRIRMIFSNEHYLEILPAQAGKGNALRFIADFLHTPISHTFAAGDAENDISMLQAAGTGIAMANAQEAVKKAALIVTEKTNDENGLLEIIEKYFLS